MFSMVGVSTTVDWRRQRIQALRNVSLRLGAREVVGIIDPGYVGTMALLDVASGLVRPEAGRIRLNDIDLTELSRRRRETLRSRQILWVDDRAREQCPYWTVHNYIELTVLRSDAYRGRTKRDLAVRRVVYGLELMGVSDLASIRIGELSFWELVRVELARMIAAHMPLVTISGLFNGLGTDAQEARRLLRLAVDDAGCGVLLACNSTSLWMADRAWRLDRGELSLLFGVSPEDRKIVALKGSGGRSTPPSFTDKQMLTPASEAMPSQAVARIDKMPTISRFFGIVISMYFDDHEPPHFHARSGEFNAKVRADTLELLAGDLPRRDLRLVLAWAELRAPELMDNWQRARAGETLWAIEPL
jgi:ABC-type branched-subunit amino acid transport system ATPase component